MFDTGVVRANEVNHSARSGGIIGIFLSIFFNMKVCCMISLESPHRGDSHEYTSHTSINIIKKITLNYSKYNNASSYWNVSTKPGRVTQSVGHLTHKSEVLSSIPGLATYFRFSFR